MAEGLVLEWTTEEGVQLKLTAGTGRIEEVAPGAELGSQRRGQTLKTQRRYEFFALQ